MKQRDLELLSSYLDGQLSPSDATRLEARLLVEPDLRSVLRDLRSARTVLRQLPMRKAPRSFRLTPKMVGKNPPLPRAYPAFRFTSALATIMLFITVSLNFIRPQLATSRPAFGMGGGGGAPDTYAAESAPAAEAPAPEEPSVAMVPQPTMTGDETENARVIDTPAAKTEETPLAIGGGVDQPPAQDAQAENANTAPVVPAVWQWLLAGIALVSAFVMAMMRQLSSNRWRKKN